MNRTTPLKQRSAKRVAEDREREKAKAIVRQRARGGCEAAQALASVEPTMAACSGRFEFHEVLTRARGGSISDPSNILMVCSRHHLYLTERPLTAAGLGLVQNSWTAPPKKPILHTGLRAVNVRPRVEPRPKAPTPAVAPESARSDEPDVITLSFVHPARPFTVNGERKMTPYRRAEVVREWRKAFADLALGSPRLAWCDVEAKVYLRDMRGQDVGGALPSAKAAVDGIKDAGVLIDDDPRYVRRLSFPAPQKQTYDALEIVLTGPLA